MRLDKPLTGKLDMVNGSTEERTVTIQIYVDLISYTGMLVTHVFLLEELLIFAPGESKHMKSISKLL